MNSIACEKVCVKSPIAFRLTLTPGNPKKTFDIELFFLWLWAMLFRRLGWFGFVEMLVFLGILMLGFAYIWRKGGLEWE